MNTTSATQRNARFEATPGKPVRHFRVASCIHSMAPSGGSELNAVRTAEQLKLRGHEVFAVTLTEDQTGMWARYTDAGIPVSGFPVDSLIGRKAFHQVRNMASFFSRHRIDVVHTHDCYTNFLMVLSARLAGIPVLASKRYTRHLRPQHRFTDMVGFALSRRVLANSVEVARSVHTSERVSLKRVEVVPNFLDDEAFSASGQRGAWRQRFGFADDAVVFCIVAQLRAEKNHGTLLNAFATVSSISEKARLLIVGDGPEREQIQLHVQELGLERSVVVAGHVPKAWQTFSAADVALLPSEHEGFPNSIIEAMAAGCPIIASRVGGIPDAVEDGVTGLLVPPGNEGELSKAMLRMLNDSSLREMAGALARDKAEKHYRATPVINQVEQLYAALLSEKK